MLINFRVFITHVITIILLLLLTNATISTAAAAGGTTWRVCASGCDFSTIQQAITAASPGDTIELFFLSPHTEVDIIVSKDLEFVGLDRQDTIVQAAATYNSAMGRVFTIMPDVSVTMRNFKIRHGLMSASNGGGITIMASSDPDATVLLQDMEIAFNAAARGGGIANAGRLTLDNVVVQSNEGGSQGGGVYNLGEIDAADTTISFNNAFIGGGIYNGASFAISGVSAVALNHSQRDGGGIVNHAFGEFTMQDGQISQNQTALGTLSGCGGGIISAGVLSLTDVNIMQNQSRQDSGNGGGVCNVDGTAVIEGGSVENNTAALDGGGIYQEGGVLTVSGVIIESNDADAGGGIAAAGGELAIANTTVVANSSVDGGGINIANGNINIRNASINDNQADSDGGGLHYEEGNVSASDISIKGNSASVGGGIHTGNGTGNIDVRQAAITGNTADFAGGVILAGSTSKFTNATIAGNIAAYDGGGVYAGAGTSIFANVTIAENEAVAGNGGGMFIVDVPSVDITIKSTIIAGNSFGSNGGPHPDCHGHFDIATHSLIGDTGPRLDECTWTVVRLQNMLSNIDAKLDEPVGGRYLWHYPLEALSPAIDMGLCVDADNAALGFDQIEASMPVDGDHDNDADCDMGSVEYGGVPLALTGVTQATTAAAGGRTAGVVLLSLLLTIGLWSRRQRLINRTG